MIIITGPTGTGKTELGLKIAEKINGEIISADSRQVYRYLKTGTSKPEGAWKTSVRGRRYFVEGIAYHLVDFLEPDEVFSAGDFVREARKIIREIEDAGKIPVLVGGTGLYINSLVDGITKLPSRDEKVREELREIERENGAGYLYENTIIF